MGDDAHQRTLYVGNLDHSVTEELLVALFSKIGKCTGCKIIREPGNDLYAFVEFGDQSSAQMALMAMNKRSFLGREMKVNWATSPGSHNKQDTTNHFHVFVGDLSSDIDTNQLREMFQPFGEMSDCKVIRDPQTQMSKGFGFVSFIRKEDAECAIAGMNGQWLGNKPIRTNWASRKPAPSSHREGSHKQLRYDDVYNQTSATNCTVYCGGIMSGLTEELMQEAFANYGAVQEVRIFKEKGFAFVRFDTKKAATEAIVGTHGTEIGGYSVKCSWGKETTEGSQGQGGYSGATSAAAAQRYSATPQFTQQQSSFLGPAMGYYNYPTAYASVAPQYGQHHQQPMQQQQQQNPYMPSGYGYGYDYGTAMWGSAPGGMMPNSSHQQNYN